MRFLPFAKGKKGFQFAGGGVSDSGGGGGGSYVLPIASANTLGGVKIGSGLNINPSGVLTSGVELSSNEFDTGLKWIDGRSIYGKVLTIPTMPNNEVIHVNHNITNIDWCYFTGVCVNSEHRTISIPAVGNQLENMLYGSVSSTQLNIGTGIDYSSYTGYILLIYTKVTQ